MTPFSMTPRIRRVKRAMDRVDTKLQLTTITEGKNTNKHRERGE
jgi:hypothetical protein